MIGVPKYSIPSFMKDAREILARDMQLDDKKAEIGDRLAALSRRDDLTRYGLPLGPTDAANENYILFREPPHTSLLLIQFDPGYMSPIHEHGDFWVVACGYRGRDRWDMYERTDDGTRPGHAEIKLVDQIDIPPGRPVWMPAPPKAIHSHNNQHDGLTMELIFTAAEPMDPKDRLIYDPDDNSCWPSSWAASSVMGGDRYPAPPVAARTHFDRAMGSLGQWSNAMVCPLCRLIRAAAGPTYRCDAAA